MKRTAPEATLLVAGEVYTPEKRIRGGALVIQGGKILFAGPKAEAARRVKALHDRSRSFDLEILAYPDFTAVPGFIDIHLHGGNGADIMDGTPEAVATALRPHLVKGTTSVLATVMTAAHEDILRAIAAVRQAVRESAPTPDVLGIHLEGPYIAKEKSGAQPEAHIRPFAASEMREYVAAAEGKLKIVTLAPELAGGKSFLAGLKKTGILAAAGHSQATFAEAQAAIRAGIRHGTHLFNAMSGVFHRDPGLAGALLLDDAVSVEVIADGIHLHPAVLEFVLRLKPKEKVILISDATRRAGESREPLRTPDGRLYGSSITLAEAVLNVAAWTRRPLAEILPLATSNPARLAGAYPRKGRLGRGADADIVLLDRGCRVRKVFLRGKEVV